MSTAFNYKPNYQQAYFDQGEYLFRIKEAKLNSRGEPSINMQVKASFDGRRINSYYNRNFFMNSDKPKGRELWTRKFDMLLRALGIDELHDLDQLVGHDILVRFRKADYEPVPDFLTSEQATQALHTERVSPMAPTHTDELPPLDAYDNQ